MSHLLRTVTANKTSEGSTGGGDMSTPTQAGRRSSSEDEGIDDEELLARLDDQFELSGLRQKRMEELRKEIAKNQEMQANHHGRYIEIKHEKELIQITAKSSLSVVHFFHEDFEKCKIMDQKLEELSSKYFTTRFLRVNVANVPWLVSKLEVQVLPCVVGFVDGISKERIIGFDGIASDQSIKQIDISKLEQRLKKSGVIKEVIRSENMIGTKSNDKQASFSTGIRQLDLDDDGDWDD